MKVLVTAAGLAAVGVLVLSGCSGGDEGAGASTPGDASAATQGATAGARTSSPHQVDAARIEVKDDYAFMVGTITNTTDRDVKVQSLYVNGFKIAEVGQLEDGVVSRPSGGIPIARGETLELGTTGWVARLAIPDDHYQAGAVMRVNVNFTDNSHLVLEAELTADVAPS